MPLLVARAGAVPDLRRYAVARIRGGHVDSAVGRPAHQVEGRVVGELFGGRSVARTEPQVSAVVQAFDRDALAAHPHRPVGGEGEPLRADRSAGPEFDLAGRGLGVQAGPGLCTPDRTAGTDRLGTRRTAGPRRPGPRTLG